MINSFDNCNIALHFGGPAPKYKQRRGNYPPRPGGGSYASAMTKMTFDWSPASMRVAIQDKEQLFCQSRAAPPAPGGGTCKVSFRFGRSLELPVGAENTQPANQPLTPTTHQLLPNFHSNKHRRAATGGTRTRSTRPRTRPTTSPFTSSSTSPSAASGRATRPSGPTCPRPSSSTTCACSGRTASMRARARAPTHLSVLLSSAGV